LIIFKYIFCYFQVYEGAEFKYIQVYFELYVWCFVRIGISGSSICQKFYGLPFLKNIITKLCAQNNITNARIILTFSQIKQHIKMCSRN